MGALVTVMVSPKLADGCDVAEDAAAALVADGWTPPAPCTGYPSQMKHLIDSARLALKDENWYAALTLALSFPDICASLESPSGKTSPALYKAWVERYLTPKYTHPLGADLHEHIFLSGRDCYALRCAFLHQGITETTGHPARESLSSFEFTAPIPGSIHCNQVNNKLQLQIDLFTEDMCEAVELWLSATETNPDVSARISQLMLITEVGPGGSFVM